MRLWPQIVVTASSMIGCDLGSRNAGARADHSVWMVARRRGASRARISVFGQFARRARLREQAPETRDRLRRSLRPQGCGGPGSAIASDAALSTVKQAARGPFGPLR